MPVEEVLGPVMRVAVSIAVDVLIDKIIRGPGYAIARLFNRNKEPATWLTSFIGTLFWLVVIVAAYVAFTCFAEGIAVDKCLDAGGKYDYRAEKCLLS